MFSPIKGGTAWKEADNKDKALTVQREAGFLQVPVTAPSPWFRAQRPGWAHLSLTVRKRAPDTQVCFICLLLFDCIQIFRVAIISNALDDTSKYTRHSLVSVPRHCLSGSNLYESFLFLKSPYLNETCASPLRASSRPKVALGCLQWVWSVKSLLFYPERRWTPAPATCRRPLRESLEECPEPKRDRQNYPVTVSSCGPWADHRVAGSGSP